MNEVNDTKPSTLRSILVVVGSLLVGAIVMSAVQAISHMLFPPPDGLDYKDPEQLKQMMDSMPLAALWLLELSYALGCFVAGVVLAFGLGRRMLKPAFVVGGLFTLLGFINLAQIPTPTWLAVLTTITYIPATLAGMLIISRRSQKQSERDAVT